MRGVIVTCALVVLLPARPPATAEQEDASTAALVERAAAYVRDYQERLTAVVADETYTQHVRAQVPRDKGMPPRRTLTSEIFFLYVPGHDWMAMRDVELLDRRPVPDRPDLMRALRTLPAPQVARTFKAYNSRFNLGRVVRNFNEPTLSLLVLDAGHRGRFRFTLLRTVIVKGERLTTIGFREITGPTLVGDLNGGAAFSAGEVTIEPETGRVRRTLLALTIDSVQMTLSTTYEQDARLDMLVPVRFGERYEDGSAGTAAHEEILCEAKYTDFRRFEVKAILR